MTFGGVPPPDFFFLILMPGTGAEFRASRNPVHSIAVERTRESGEHHVVSLNTHTSRLKRSNLRCAGMILTLISLAELEGMFRGLYFFSRGGASNGPELFGGKIKHVSAEISNIRGIYMKTPQDGAVLTETVPRPLEERRLDVVLVAELWGSRRLLRWGWVWSVHLQSCVAENMLSISYRT